MKAYKKEYEGTLEQYNDLNNKNLVKKIKYNMPTVSQVNSSNFGVKINYPTNANDYQGWLQLRYIRMHIYYLPPAFATVFERVGNEETLVGNTVTYKTTLTNTNKVDYSDTVTITLPATVSYYNHNGEGVTVSNNTITWKPPQSSKITVSELTLTVLLENAGTSTVTCKEEYGNNTKLQTLTIAPRPTEVESETTDLEQIIHARYNTEFILPVNLNSVLLETVTNVKIIPSETLSIYYNDEWVTVTDSNPLIIPAERFTETLNLQCKSTTAGITDVTIGTDDIIPEQAAFIVKVLPDGIDYPSLTIYQVEDEELNRMGNGIVYTVFSLMKLICDTEYIDLFEDYYRNFRLGVFNDPIPEDVTVTPEYIFDHTRYWSNAPSLFNEWETKTLEFTYNEENPVYIIFTGDFITQHAVEFQIQYSTPSLIESSSYKGYEAPGNFPFPILQTITADIPAELTVDSFKKSNPVVFYNIPVDENFGTNEQYAVRGIQLSMDVTTDNRVVALLKLKSPTGESHEKSIVIDETGTVITGGNYDTWGFKISELEKLSDWEIELEFQNPFSNENNKTSLSVNNIQLNIYFIELPNDINYCIIDGEDARHYGMFLDEDTNVPFGVNTETKYFDLDGVDLNDAYRMNIDKKEIDLVFNLFGCTFQETTQQLKEIAKLLTNKRDKLNKPIPKVIEFSFLPGEHFEYIMEDTIDPNVDVTDYNPKVKLIVPAGTSYENEDTVTNYTGINDGITKVSPIIQVIPLSNTVDISETESNQKFSITSSKLDSNKIMEINCLTRTVLLKSDENDTGEDITSSADYDVDWFALETGPFVFDDGNTAIIQSVTITKRG